MVAPLDYLFKGGAMRRMWSVVSEGCGVWSGSVECGVWGGECDV